MRKRKRNHSEINYWQSNADLITGFVLVLLLIIMLLILYLVQIPENSLPDAVSGNSYNVDDQLGDAGESYAYAGLDDVEGDDEGNDDTDSAGVDGGGGDGGGGGEEQETVIEEEYEYPYPTSSGDDWSKAAVYATVIDAETGRAIRVAGLTFELYEEQNRGDGGTKRFLNTYYPVKTEYRSYETTEAGVFYLPEKVEQGHYYFKQITELEGYDMADTVYFDVDDSYDWPDPYVVSIEISPSKNIIPIQLEDAQTHEPVTGGTFQITAAEDILTADDSVRYAKDEVADTVDVNEEGYGESEELYLGTYLVSQDTIPQYYASVEESVERDVEKKDGSTPETIVFSCEKTRISLRLTDELYTNLELEGAEFTLTCDGHPELTQTGVTDENGELVFTNLEKDRVYRLQQTGAPDNYRYEDVETQIYVDQAGRIDGEAEAAFELTNYIARMNIEVRGRILGGPVSNVSLALYDNEDQLIRVWTSSGSAETFENLATGRYYVLLDGDENHRYEIDFVEDEALQEVIVTIWTLQDIIAVVLGAAAVLLVIVAVMLLLKKRNASKRQKIGEETEREE